MIEQPKRGRPRMKISRGKKLVPLVVLVPRDMKEALEAQATEDGVTVAHLVRTILSSFNGDFT